MQDNVLFTYKCRIQINEYLMHGTKKVALNKNCLICTFNVYLLMFTYYCLKAIPTNISNHLCKKCY